MTTAARIEADVVIVGGGGSGLAAAIEARTLGRHVILLEKNPNPGGSTAWSIGSVTSTNTPHQLREGIHDRPEDHFTDMGLFCARLGLSDREDLRRLLVDNIPDTFRWLMSMGVRFLGPLAEPPHRKPRMHNVLPNSRAFIYHLGRRARKIGVEIRTGVRARDIILADGKAVGVLADTPQGPVAFHARGGVVLATGDFGGSPEMRAKYIAPALAQVTPINATNTGDGHQMALALGGRIIHPELHLAGIRFQAPPKKWINHVPPWPWLMEFAAWGMRNLPSWLSRPFIMAFLTTILVPTPHLYQAGGILINRKGERFTDELGDAAPAVAQQPEHLAYILLDARVKDQFADWPNYVSTAPGVAYAFLPDYRRNRKDIYKEAGSLRDLAGRIGVPADTLERTVADYNAGAGEGQNRSGRPPIGAGPYVALGPVRYYFNFTDSGVAINDRLEVLGTNDQPIQGLYAVGFVGMGGMLLEGHGHHLAWAFTSGRLAGRAAAYRAVTKDPPLPEGYVASGAGQVGQH